MTGTSNPLLQQTELLIDLLRRDVTAACQREADAAQQRASETLRGAYRAASRVAREAVQDERRRLDSTLTRVRAAAETRRREIVRRETGRVVSEGRRRLPATLAAMWKDGATRTAWCQVAIREAAQRLQVARWQIRCASPAGGPELEQLCEFARGQGVREVVAVTDLSGAGITIESSGATFDATLEGLLASPESIDAELHAAWLEEAAG
ncbi:MAG: hypothetical protein WCE48_06870 [Steroidobacteraceae bacterium]